MPNNASSFSINNGGDDIASQVASNSSNDDDFVAAPQNLAGFDAGGRLRQGRDDDFQNF